MKIKAVHLLNFGLLQTEEEALEFSSMSPTGYYLRPNQIDFIDICDKLKGVKGLKFGIEYFIEGINDNQEIVEFLSKISHPTMIEPLTNEELKEVSEKKTNYINQKNFDYYCFEHNWEIVKGIWTFEIIEKGQVFLAKEFKIE
jgi:hypothetical protein